MAETVDFFSDVKFLIVLLLCLHTLTEQQRFQ